MLSYMLMKSWLPFAPKRPGEVLLVVPIGLMQRVLVHRTPAMVLMAYLLLGNVPALAEVWLIPGTQAIGIVGLFIVLILPLRYVFTDRGVALNNGVPRLYRSFRRFDTRPGKRLLADNVTVFLRGRKTEKGQIASYALYIPSAAQADVLRVLKKHVR